MGLASNIVAVDLAASGIDSACCKIILGVGGTYGMSGRVGSPSKVSGHAERPQVAVVLLLLAGRQGALCVLHADRVHLTTRAQR